MKLKKFSYLQETKIIKFKEENKKVTCDLLTNGGLTKQKFDKVFVGSGPVATSILCINSDFTKKVTFQSSDLLQVPYFKFKTQEKKKTSFADIFVYDKKNRFYLQIYFYSKSVMKLAENIIRFINLDKIIPNQILNFFGGIFIYLDSSFSSTFSIEKRGQEIELNLEKESIEQSKILKEISKNLRKSGFFLISFLKNKSRYGQSYHFGSQFPHSHDMSGNKTDFLGRLNNMNNIHIIDSSVLPNVNNGPITNIIMANSYRITEESLKKTND